jgi:outer membrane lipoprotein LolB
MTGFSRVAFAAFACATLLLGCASLQGELGAGTQFELIGRVAVRHGGEASSARVQWRHGLKTDDMLITSPIGQGVARITRAGGMVILETGDNRKFQAQSAESLTQEVLGWRLPLTGLSDWIRARPSLEGAHVASQDEKMRLARLEQDGWQIEYQEYDEDRPVRIRLLRPELEIRLVIETWREFAP